MTVEDLAKAIICLAADGGMPDTFWESDSRITAACDILRLTPTQARLWGELHDWTDDL